VEDETWWEGAEGELFRARLRGAAAIAMHRRLQLLGLREPPQAAARKSDMFENGFEEVVRRIGCRACGESDGACPQRQSPSAR
jgi:hypothetical protein